MFPMFPRICSKFEVDQTSGSDFRTKKRKNAKIFIGLSMYVFKYRKKIDSSYKSSGKKWGVVV